MAGDGISAGTIYIDAKVRLDEASARQAVTQAQGQANAGGSVSAGRGARVSPGANVAVESDAALRSRIISENIGGSIAVGMSTPGFMSGRAGNFGAGGGLGPNLIRDFTSQAIGHQPPSSFMPHGMIPGAASGAGPNAAGVAGYRGVFSPPVATSIRDSGTSRPAEFRNRLDSIGRGAASSLEDQMDAAEDLARQNRSIDSSMRSRGSGLSPRRFDGMRTGLGNAGSAIGRAMNSNVMSTGMFMNFLFGGWEVNTASNAAAMGQSAARANAFDPSMAFKAERAGLDRIMGGPMGSLVGMFNQGGVLAADSTFLAGERGGGRADAQQARRQEIEISGMRAGGAGQTFLNAKQLQIQREREMKGELDLEKSERSASAEAARQKAINDYKTGRIEWVETGDIFNPNKRANAKGQAAYDAVSGDDGNVRKIKSSRKQITDNDAMMFLKELGGEYRDIGRGFAGIGRGVMGAAKNVFEQMQGQFVQAGSYNAMAQAYGMMGTNPLGAQLTQIEAQRQQALFQNRHAMPQVITGLNAGFDAYRRFAQQQDGNSRTMLRGGMLNDLASAGLHASGRQFSAESQNIFGGAMNAYTGFAQQGDMENAGLALQTGRAQLVSFRQSLIDRGIGSAQTGMGAFRTDFSGGASRPNQESIKEALKTTEDHLANISKMISNMGIQ